MDNAAIARCSESCALAGMSAAFTRTKKKWRQTMKISQHVGLVLSGAVALNSWMPAVAQENEAKPNWPTAPVHELPPQSWPEPPKAPPNAPNVVVILIDDVGFGATSAFGGPI